MFILTWNSFGTPALLDDPGGGNRTEEVDIQCINDFERWMQCTVTGIPSGAHCANYTLQTKIDIQVAFRPMEAECRLQPGTLNTCSCNLTINGFALDNVFTTTLWNANKSKELLSKDINSYIHIKPKTPKLTAVDRDTENNGYDVKWDYHDTSKFPLYYLVNYRKRGQETEPEKWGRIKVEYPLSVDRTAHIRQKDLEANTEYLVSVSVVAEGSNLSSDSSNEIAIFTAKAPVPHGRLQLPAPGGADGADGQP